MELRIGPGVPTLPRDGLGEMFARGLLGGLAVIAVTVDLAALVAMVGSLII